MPDDPEATHDHSHAELPLESWRRRIATTLGAIVVIVLNVTGVLPTLLGVDTSLLVAVVMGYSLVVRAVRALVKGRLTYDVTIALAAIVALAAGEFLAAAEVTLIVTVGDALEHWAIHRANRAIAGLLSMQPDRACVVRAGLEQTVLAADVQLSDRVIVRSGERIPVDGIVVDGEARVDQSLITGESVGAAKTIGAHVFSGSVVEQGALDVAPESVGGDTTLARITRLIADAQRRRAPMLRVADRFSELFLPFLVGSAVAVYLLTGDALRSVAVLLVGCSCALVYAAPAAFSAALARLSRAGVLVKGGDVLERLATVTVVAFDKTGTLTTGRPSVTNVVAARGFDPDDVIRMAAAAESRSEHCLGRAIVAEAGRRQLALAPVDRFTQAAGLGVAATIAGRDIRVGNLAFMRELSPESVADGQRLIDESGEPNDTHVVVTVDGVAAGVVLLRDSVRADAARAVEALRASGIARIAMLTGDARDTALAIASRLAIEAGDVHAELLPADKLTHLRELEREGAHVLMVGDGINDAPALAMAHVGAAFGRGAADLSVEAAQVVVLDSGLSAIPDLLAFSRKTLRRVRFNIIAFAVGINLVAIVAAGLGYLKPAASAILHQVVSLAVITSSVSLLVNRRWFTNRASTNRTLALREPLAWIRASVVAPMVQGARQHQRNLLRGCLGAGIGVWALSGVTVLGPSESAVVQRFGRLVAADLGPGLHVRAPWPIETITRLSPTRIRVLDIGFRGPSGPLVGAIDYEWDSSHDAAGLVQQVPDENLVLTGDENLAELYAVVHYRVAVPSRYLFGAREPEALVRVIAEGALRDVTASYSLDALLTTDRLALERRWADAMRVRLGRLDVGVEIIGIHLSDVHPPVEVVSAFREVASAQEEELMNTLKAEGYLKEQIPLARGNVQASLESAAGYRASRIDRSEGDSARFLAQLSVPDGASTLTKFRLQLETLETVLPGKRLVIVDDKSGGRRTLTFLQDGADFLRLLGLGGGEPERPEPPPPPLPGIK